MLVQKQTEEARENVDRFRGAIGAVDLLQAVFIAFHSSSKRNAKIRMRDAWRTVVPSVYPDDESAAKMMRQSKSAAEGMSQSELNVKLLAAMNAMKDAAVPVLKLCRLLHIDASQIYVHLQECSNLGARASNMAVMRGILSNLQLQLSRKVTEPPMPNANDELSRPRQVKEIADVLGIPVKDVKTMPPKNARKVNRQSYQVYRHRCNQQQWDTLNTVEIKSRKRRTKLAVTQANSQ